jgi:hypothetical protein
MREGILNINLIFFNIFRVKKPSLTPRGIGGAKSVSQSKKGGDNPPMFGGEWSIDCMFKF